MADLLEEVLSLSTRLGNISEACRQLGISRATLYRWMKRGAVPAGPHTRATPEEVCKQVLAQSRAHPKWGCKMLSAELGLMGQSLSPPTVQKILVQAGVGNWRDRWIALEDIAKEGTVVSAEQTRFIERCNPCFRNRASHPKLPGRQLVQTVVPAGGQLKPLVSCVHLVTDSRGCFAFARFSGDRSGGDALRLLEDEVLPFYERLGIPLDSVWFDRRGACLVKGRSAVSGLLERKGVTLRRRRSGNDGCADRLLSALRAEFVASAKPGAGSLEGLERQLQEWLFEWNWKRSLPGFPNYGAAPGPASGWSVAPGQAKGSRSDFSPPCRPEDWSAAAS